MRGGRAEEERGGKEGCNGRGGAGKERGDRWQGRKEKGAALFTHLQSWDIDWHGDICDRDYHHFRPISGDKLSGSYASPLHDQLLVSQLHTVEALDSL